MLNLISFIIDDLDVTFLDIFKSEDNIVKLNYESNGYPYGGPDSLIFFLRAFNCIANKTDEGSDIYTIIWNSNFDFEFRKINSKEIKGIRKILKRIFKT
ncbi:MAG: hypothetical protein AB8B78_01245 [Polaribacter sp.]